MPSSFELGLKEKLQSTEIINQHCKARVMEVNVYKTSILFNGIGEHHEKQFNGVLPFTSVPFENGLKYTGLFLKPIDYRYKDSSYLWEK